MSQVCTTPHRSTPVDAVVALPGSKSITARALILAAIADGPSRLVRPLRARDTDLMAGGLRALGVRIQDDGDDQLVTPSALRGPAQVDAGLAGTVLRFLPPVPGLGDVQPQTLEVAVNQAVLGKASPEAALSKSADNASKLMDKNLDKFGSA